MHGRNREPYTPTRRWLGEFREQTLRRVQKGLNTSYFRLISDTIIRTDTWQMATKHIVNAKRERDEGITEKTRGRPSLFRHLLDSGMPECDKSVERLSREAQVLLGAGSASTARTLDFICYYILAKPGIHSRLQEELREVMAGYPSIVPSWSQLEKLPYLQAVIKEGLR